MWGPSKRIVEHFERAGLRGIEDPLRDGSQALKELEHRLEEGASCSNEESHLYTQIYAAKMVLAAFAQQDGASAAKSIIDQQLSWLFDASSVAGFQADSLRELVRALRNKERAFCLERMAWLYNQIGTGDHGTGRVQAEVTKMAWLYNFRRKGEAALEQESLYAFIAEEFADDELEAVEWALRTHAVSEEDLKKAEVRVGEVHMRNPDGNRETRVAFLYWLDRAYSSYFRGGSCQSAYDLVGKAAEILRRMENRNPTYADAAELWAKAEEAKWLYLD
jgi:hypothetical protein